AARSTRRRWRSYGRRKGECRARDQQGDGGRGCPPGAPLARKRSVRAPRIVPPLRAPDCPVPRDCRPRARARYPEPLGRAASRCRKSPGQSCKQQKTKPSSGRHPLIVVALVAVGKMHRPLAEKRLLILRYDKRIDKNVVDELGARRRRDAEEVGLDRRRTIGE